MKAHRLILPLLFALTAGCGARVTPPPAPADAVPVFFVDYGRHASVVLSSQSEGLLYEYAFGDWDWFAMNRNEWHDALEALFCSRGATLGRRIHEPPSSTEQFAIDAGAHRVLEFAAPRRRVDVLLARLERRYRRHLDTQVYNPLARLYFVRDDAHYALWRNCNHETARWLEAVGCEVRGMRMTSGFKFAK